MNDLWTEKYRPKKFDDVLVNISDKNKMETWIKKIVNNNYSVNCLLLYGAPGIGKTTIATLLLEKYNFDVIEYNASDLRNQKTLRENLEKINGNVNILDFMCNKKKKIGIIIDELDGINSTDRGALKELISIISISNKVSSPFICISNSLNKKFNSLKKKSLFLKINRPSLPNITKIAETINSNENLNLNYSDLKLIVNHSQNDIRKLISTLEYYSIDPKINDVETFLENIDKKNIEYSIIDYSDKLLNNYIFDMNSNLDKNMISFYFYENFIKFIIKNKNENKNKKFEVIATIYKYFTYSDIVEKNIYLLKDFTLYNYYYKFKCSIPSYLINNMKKHSYNKVNSLDYSKLINKTSLEYLNNKHLTIIKYNFLGYSDCNNIIYIIDLLYIYLFKNNNKKIINYYLDKELINIEFLIKILKYSTLYNKDNKDIKLTNKYIMSLIK